MTLAQVKLLVSTLSASVPGMEVTFTATRDLKRPEDGRVFIQCSYDALCTVSGLPRTWKGRKWYLSDHMTEDEVVKTCYAAFKAAVEHEVMEGFKVNGQRVFNPHTPYQVLMQAAAVEMFRGEPAADTLHVTTP